MPGQRQLTQNPTVSQTLPLWEFVRLSEYRQPSATATSAARLKWASFKRFFVRFETEDAKPIKEETELQSFSQAGLARLVGEIDWNEVATAFDQALQDRTAAFSEASPVKFVVAPPYTGHGEMLHRWSLDRGINRIDPPTVDQILGAPEAWLSDWPNAERMWVLPHLEHCYLRHAQGLKLIRRLFEAALGGSLGYGVIGCDSWAWTYLQYVWPFPHRDVLTLQGFDGARLTRLFFQLTSSSRRNNLIFRNMRNGKTVLLKPDAEGHEVSPELNQLAVYCRGNFGIARQYWRERLKAEPEPQSGDNPQKKPHPAQEPCVWVADMPGEPALPNEKDEDTAFVIHLLLLHDGLPEALLPELLPLPRHRIMAVLLRLKDLGIVAEQRDAWRITARGYISARDYLRARDYSLDGF